MVKMCIFSRSKCFQAFEVLFLLLFYLNFHNPYNILLQINLMCATRTGTALVMLVDLLALVTAS